MTGFRCELVCRYELHVAVGVTFGPDVPVIYVQFGSVWM